MDAARMLWRRRRARRRCNSVWSTICNTLLRRELELLLMSGLPKYINTWHWASLMLPQTNSWEQYRCKTREVRAMEPSALRFLTASTDWFSLATVAIRH